MSAVGFGKPPQALRNKGKRKKPKGKLKTYTMAYFGSNRVFPVVELRAKSRLEAQKKFSVFIDALDFCLSDATDEQILQFIEENPL